MIKYWLCYMDYESADLLTEGEIRKQYGAGPRGQKEFEKYKCEYLTDDLAYVKYTDTKDDA